MNDDDPLTEAMQSQGRALRALARSILRDADGADDAVQDACVAALRSSPPTNAPGWLARVVRNFALRARRDGARRKRLDAANAGEPPVAEPAADACAQLDEHERLVAAVRALPAPLRAVVVLRYWHDLPPRRIAQQLALPVATVKTHLQRGLAALRSRLRAEHGDRGTWLAALVPIAHPRLLARAASGTPVAAAAATLAIMKSYHVVVLAAAALLLGVAAWQPWLPTTPPTKERPAAAAPATASTERAADNPTARDVDAPPRIERTAAAPAVRTCTLVGRIVGPDERPVPDARLRLVNLFEHPDTPLLTAAAAADGSFALVAPRPHRWLFYQFAIAGAPGWAARERELAVQQEIVDDRLDLGTFRLERGVAVAGRVVEADGSPLRARARLLAWDASKRGSMTSMYRGRTVGFAEPGGAFALEDRLSAQPSGAWTLAAVSASGVGWATLAFAAGEQHLDPVEIRLLPGGSVDVQVVDPDGKPLAGVRVAATPHFQPIGLAPMWEAARADNPPNLAEVEALFVRTTDADGRARFANLPRREHESIRAANEDQRPAPAIVVTAARDGFVNNMAEVDPTADGAAPVRIVLTPQRRIAFHGTVATKDGKRLPGVTVRLNGPDSSAVTDTEGRYELPAKGLPGNHAYFLIEGDEVPLVRELVDLPVVGDRVAHDFVVEQRAPVTGRVVDQSGAPVAGVELHLGIPKGIHYASTPKRTGADGAFAFPDAIPSHTDLWVRPPEPQTAWRVEASRALTRRDGEVIVLHRLDGPLVDLAIAIVDGRSGAQVSPTDVQVQRLNGSTHALGQPFVQSALALGLATVPKLPPGSYRAVVRAAGDLRAEHDFTLPDTGKHTERVEVWPAVSLVCTIDTSALPAEELAARNGKTVLVALDAQSETSQIVDASGKQLNYTRNTGSFCFGGEMTFRLVGVTPNVARRLRVLGNDFFGEAWFTATPGADARVTLRIARAGRLAFVAPATWPAGAIEVDVRDGDAWRLALSWDHGASTGSESPWPLPRPAGDTAWRLRRWPADGGPLVETSGTAAIVAGQQTTVALAPK